MFRGQYFTRFGIFNLILILLVFLITPIQAQEDVSNSDPFAKFGTYTKESDWVVHHTIWNRLLDATVLVVPPSARKLSSTKNSPATGTKISRGSRSSARFESNRIFFHSVDEETLEIISKYRRELEDLPNYYPLEYFNQDEQLAYWLNLYNAVLFEQLAKRYPISKLKRLRNGGKGKPSLWDEKLMTVAGVSLSLNDIQNNILIRHWKSPMVLYGLFQGAIGGPSLPNRAFTGLNVHRVLNSIAREFVNSNRGMKNWGDATQVSLMYEWGKAAFPNWDRDLASHLASFATTTAQNQLRNSSGFKAKLYDWSIADTKGGTLSAGPKISTAANMLTLGQGDNVASGLPIQPQTGNPQLITSTPNQFAFDSTRTSLFANEGGISQMLTNLYRNDMIVPGAYDANTAKLLREIKQKLLERPEGIVTSLECGPDLETCPETEIEGEEDRKED